GPGPGWRQPATVRRCLTRHGCSVAMGQNRPMDKKAWRAQMRGAVSRGDGAAGVGLLERDGLPGDAPQLAGEGLLAAPVQGVDGAAGVAALAVKALRNR